MTIENARYGLVQLPQPTAVVGLAAKFHKLLKPECIKNGQPQQGNQKRYGRALQPF
jgi:hypothetical protein